MSRSVHVRLRLCMWACVSACPRLRVYVCVFVSLCLYLCVDISREYHIENRAPEVQSADSQPVHQGKWRTAQNTAAQKEEGSW